MKNIFSIQTKYRKWIIPTIIVVIGLIIAFSIFFGLFEKFFIKRSFEKAFFYRAVGNCDAFVEYIAKAQNEWRDMCIREKNGFRTPIKDFKVLRIDYIRRDKKAFLQVRLTIDVESYIVNYEVKKEGLRWKITNEICGYYSVC